MSELIQSPNTTVAEQRGQQVGAPAPVPPSQSPVQMPSLNLAEIFRAILRRSWIVVACMIMGLVGMFVLVSKMTTLYRSHGALFVKTQAPQVLVDGIIAQEDSKDLEQMKTVEQGLLSSTVLLKVVEKHQLAEEESFSPDKKTPQALVDTMLDRVRVELRKGTRLIDVYVEDSNPQRAAKMVEDLIAEYEIWKNAGRAELVKKTSEDLEDEVVRLREKMEQSESRLEEFRRKNPVLGLNVNEEQTQDSKLGMLNREMTQVTAERLRLEAEYKSLTGEGNGASSRVLAAKGEQEQLILELERNLAQQEAEFAQLKQRYLHKHPRYIEAANVIASLKENIAAVEKEAEASLVSRLDIVRQREQQLTRLAKEAEVQALEDEQLRERFVRLSREVALDRDLHSQVSKRLQETQVGASLTASFLRWEQKPIPPDEPSRPLKKELLAAGLVAGALLGCLLGLLLELLDRRVREHSAVERVLQLPMLANVPAYHRAVVDELSVPGKVIYEDEEDIQVTPLTLRGRDTDDAMETMLFTSSFDGDGKSLCVLKSARTMVKQGYRTLVIDADFSQQGISREMARGQERRFGLAAYLMGESEAAQVLADTTVPGLWFLPTGALEGDTGDMLAGPGFRNLLRAVEPMFDRVVIDVASLSQSDDVQALARHLHKTYFVVRKGAGSYRDLKENLGTLRSCGARVMGFIWNEGGRRGRPCPVIEPLEFVATEPTRIDSVQDGTDKSSSAVA